MTGSEIRRRFLGFFQQRGHKIVPSSSLVPAHDPTLLFTNAGMNQFKDVFLGVEKRDYQRATTVQKCVRAGGKHNDLENVGFTYRHHTFFEMLGNFSFGDYFKADAIAYAWELVTDGKEGFGLDPSRLYVTIFENDDEAEKLWLEKTSVPAKRIFRLGEKDNFWAMGETGPCGPCSELHVDIGAAASDAGHADCRFPCDCGRYVEIWNLVFMQYERDGSGKMTPLPRPSIDTGAGLERLTAVLQGKISNYDTDLFQPIIRHAGELAKVEYGRSARTDVSLRIVADHARAATMLIHDGVLPSNEGRGYVLRKIMRRGIRHGRLLGVESAFLYQLSGTVIRELAPAYPELEAARERIAAAIRSEEERFAQTMAAALKELDRTPVRLADGREIALEEAAAGTQTIAEHVSGAARPLLTGARMFRLYDTFGLPLDLLRELADERGFQLDEAGFQAELESQRQRARASWKGGEKASASPVYQTIVQEGPSRFEGYEQVVGRDCRVRALVRHGELAATAAAGEEIEAVLDHTPFYAASGGQIGDRGEWRCGDAVVAEVLDTYAPVAGLNVHKLRLRQPLQTGDRVVAAVDVERRDATRRNHTGTHLLHAALRQVLGPHVKQAGSVVEPGRLRFDFSHYAPVTGAQLEEIERIVNREILRNWPVETKIMPLDQALETGAMALFGEKYQERVRVVSIEGFSRELCGGTHCVRTGDIGFFKIAYETSVASGVRRIEALTGMGAWEQVREASERLQRLSEALHANEPELVEAAQRLLEQQRKLQRELERLRLKSAQASAGQEMAQRQRTLSDPAGDVHVLATRVDHLDRTQMRALLDELRAKLGRGVVVLGSAQEGKVAVVVGVTGDLTKRVAAGKIIKQLPGISGGGRPDLAEAGGKEPELLNAALEKAYAVVEQLLRNGQA